MSLSSPPKCRHNLLPWQAWLLIVAAAAVAFLIVNAENRSVSKRLAVVIRLNTNGIPTVLGIPLGNGFVRDVTLRALSRSKVPVTVLVPSGIVLDYISPSASKVAVSFVVPSGGSSAPGFNTNFLQTMNAVINAGLLSTNKPSRPSPYE